MNNEKPSSNSTEHDKDNDSNLNENQTPHAPELELANTVLAFHKDPKTQLSWMQADCPLPANLSLYLQYVANQINQVNLVFNTLKRVSQNKEEDSLPDSNEELISAALFFVRKVLLTKGANHYRVLGLKPNATLDQIRNNYRNLRRLHWNEKTPGKDESVIMRISEAYVVLREPQTKQAYNHQIQGSAYYNPDRDSDKSMRAEKRRNGSLDKSKSFKVSGLLMISLLLATILGGVWYSQQEDKSVLDERITAIPAVKERSSEGGEVIQDEAVEIQDNVSAPSKAEKIDPVTLASDESSDESLIRRIDEFVNTPLTFTDDLFEQKVPEKIAKEDVVTAEERPEPTFVDRSERQTQNTDLIEIKQLIAKAEGQFERFRLTKPVGDNAYDTYLTILGKDPENPFALSGLQRIAQKYQGMAVYRLQNENYLDALNMVRRGLDVVPAYQPLLDLEKRINENMQPAVSVVLEVPNDPEPKPNLLRIEEPLNEDADVVSVERVEAPKPEILAIESEDINDDIDVPVHVSNDLTAAELDHLLSTFVVLYEKGELEPFLELFSEDAKTNNRSSKTGVKKDYQSLFDSTSKRLIRLRDVRWSIGPKEAMGEADFTLTIVKKNAVRPRSFEGRLTFQVIKTDRIMITGLYHSQEKVER